MPGAFLTHRLKPSQVRLYPYILEISEKGWKEAVRSNNEIKEGLNIISGRVVNKNVSEAFNVEYFNPDDPNLILIIWYIIQNIYIT